MKRADRRSQSLAARTAWLFTKEGLPVLVSIIVGIVVGYFINGALGIIVATLAGFAVLKLFNRLPFRFTPWQALAIDLSPVLGKLFFSMAFLLPIASYLSLPSGHTPNTLPKYLSIAILMPKNLFLRPTSDVFPGFVILVVISIILMYWGSMNLEKTRHWLLAFLGLLLYTFSPTITSTINGNASLRILMSFFSVGYYFAWVGLLLLLLSKVLPLVLKVNLTRGKSITGMLNLIPPLIAFGFLSQLNTSDPSGHFQLFQLFDFESDHHFIAGIFSAGVAGFGAGSIVDQAEGYDGSDVPDYEGNTEDLTGSEIGPPPEEPPDVPEEPVVPPLPELDPEDPPGTTIKSNSDGSITKTWPDGSYSTKYSDGTVYGQTPDGSTGVYYPDGTTKEWTPEDGLTVTHPDGTMEITLPDGRTGGVTNDQNGNSDITSPYGGTLHIPKEGQPVGSLTTWDGNVITLNGDGSGSVTTPDGKIDIDKEGNLSGSLDDGKGNKVTINKDGSFEAETTDGDKLTLNADGLKAKFSNGDFINTDANGTPTSAHVTDEKGTIDINTDDKGTLHIKDDQGNSADINKDGSGQTKDSDGNIATQDAQGNATLTNKEGTKWVAKTDGTGYITDKKGNRIDLGKDGALTVKESNGKVTTYTPDQINQMKAQPASGQQSGGADNTTGGG